MRHILCEILQARRAKHEAGQRAHQSSLHSLRIFQDRAVSEKNIQTFWARFNAGEKKGKQLSPLWGRKVFALSQTVSATVRRFANPEFAAQYISQSKNNYDSMTALHPEKFVLQPMQFFGRNGNFLLERVYPGPNIIAFEKKQGRYFDALKRRLGRRGINLDNAEDFKRVNSAVSNAYAELKKLRNSTGIRMSQAPVNYLVLDFDPKTEKVLFASIDHENPPSQRTSRGRTG